MIDIDRRVIEQGMFPLGIYNARRRKRVDRAAIGSKTAQMTANSLKPVCRDSSAQVPVSRHNRQNVPGMFDLLEAGRSIAALSG
jgi:hypothetical protein